MWNTCWKFKQCKCQRQLATCSQLTRKMLLTIVLCVYSSSLYPHYKNPHYPQNCKKSFREKTLEIYWRVRDYKSTIIYSFFLVFFTLFPLEFHILWEGLSPNIIHTHSDCRELIWSICEVLDSCQSLVEAIGENCGI